MSAPALFLDRDGTLVEARHFPTRADELVIVAGLVEELRRARAAGFRLVLITNQSGLARGFFTGDDLERMHAYLDAELAERGIRLDGVYVCPHHPEGSVKELAIACDCRKPRPGMLLRAARELDLDLTRSWFVGDILDDVEAGNRAGCRTVLVDLGTESAPDMAERSPDFVARDVRQAVRIVLAVAGFGPDAELDYRPPAWAGSAWTPAASPVVATAGR